MSLSTSLSSALSGLTATAKSAQVVSSNMSNALNEDYGRREVQLTATSGYFDGGVRVSGISRHVDAVLLGDKREAAATLGALQQQSQAVSTMQREIGFPGDTGSLDSYMRGFESAVAFAENDPSSSVRLEEVARAAMNLTNKFNTVQDGLVTVRQRADRDISIAVDVINRSLKEIEGINQNIVASSVNGHDTSGLMDQRQGLIDTVSKYVPLEEVPRDHGAVSLYTKNGAILLESAAAELKFDRTPIIMPHMTLGSGDLSTIQIGDVSYAFESEGSPLSGGELFGMFQSRDKLAVEFQGRLDAVAYEFASAFQDSAVDPSIGATDSGLFTDLGARIDVSNVTGLAGRLQINAQVDPASTNDFWRLRDGLYAAAPGEVGNAQILGGLADTLSDRRTSALPALPDSGSLLDMSGSLATLLGTRKNSLESQQSTASARFSQLEQLHLSQGVNTDDELQKLLVIERNYAANAKVIQTVGLMLDSLMELT